MKAKHLPLIVKNRVKGFLFSNKGKLPDFIIVGAQKCGTTTIIKSLEEHPKIHITNYTYPKKAFGEVHFFNKKHMLLNGIKWYKSLFDKNLISGEKTPCYMTKKSTMQKIHKYAPNVKIIICLRDPVKRIISHLNMVNTFNNQNRKIDDVINNPEFVNRGKYYTLIKNNILPYFPKSNIHISIVDEEKPSATNVKYSNIKGLMADDSSGHINNTMKPIYDFLSIENLDIEYNYYYVGKYKKKKELNPETLKKIKKLYEEDNEKLFHFIGRRIESWE